MPLPERSALQTDTRFVSLNNPMVSLERRERLPQEGMLVQIDGSIHDWLEDRGPRMTLLLAVDDATGTVPAALFC